MPTKKTLQTIGVTLLGAVGLLLLSALLFLGVWALLPDRTGETRVYDALSFPGEAGKTELYPWDQMANPWGEAADSLDETELFHLLDPFLSPQQFPYAVNWDEIEFLCDETQSLFGFRNVNVMVRSYATVIVEDDGWEEAITDEGNVLQYRFSLALRGRYGSDEVCFVSLEPLLREEVLPAAEETGLDVLRKWAETRELNLDSGSPFASFLWRYIDFCGMLGYDYDGSQAAMLLFKTGTCEIIMENHIVYCTFTGKEGEMTLLCDPVSQTVYGISIQR